MIVVFLNDIVLAEQNYLETLTIVVCNEKQKKNRKNFEP